MPALKLQWPWSRKRHKLLIASDDLVVPLAFSAAMSAVSVGWLAWAAAVGNCSGYTRAALLSFLALRALRAVLSSYTALLCSRGAILDTAARAIAEPWIQVAIVLRVADVVVSGWALQAGWFEAYDDSCEAEAVYALRVLGTLHVMASTITVLYLFCAVKVVMRAVVKVLTKLLLLCCLRGIDDDAVETIGNLLLRFSEGVDLTLGDIAAGLILVWNRHKNARGLSELKEEQRLREGGVEDFDAIASTVPMAELDELEWSAAFAVGIYGWLLHVHRRTEPIFYLAFPVPCFICAPIAYYTCGLVRPKCVCCCGNCCAVGHERWPEADQHTHGGCLQMNRSALRVALNESMRLPHVVAAGSANGGSSRAYREKDLVVVWARWENQLQNNTHPFAVVIDHTRRSIVLTVRGTLSLADAVADCYCVEADIVLDNGRHGGAAHKAMLQAAHEILRQLGETFPGPADPDKGVLTALMRGRAPFPALEEHDVAACAEYRLVLTGHSLGAGIAGILAVLLRARWGDRVRGLLHGPPGGLLSEATAVEAEAYVTCGLYDYDIIPRLSVRTLELLRDQCLAELAQCTLSKVGVLRMSWNLIKLSARDFAMNCAAAYEQVSPHGSSASIEERINEAHTKVLATASSPKGSKRAKVAWPSQATTVSAEAWRIVEHFETLHSLGAQQAAKHDEEMESQRSRAMYPPGHLVQLRRVNSPQALCMFRCCGLWQVICGTSLSRYGVRATFVTREDLQQIVVAPPFILLDHLPNHYQDALKLHREIHHPCGRRHSPGRLAHLERHVAGHTEPEAARPPSSRMVVCDTPPGGVSQIRSPIAVS